MRLLVINMFEYSNQSQHSITLTMINNNINIDTRTENMIYQSFKR